MGSIQLALFASYTYDNLEARFMVTSVRLSTTARYMETKPPFHPRDTWHQSAKSETCSNFFLCANSRSWPGIRGRDSS